MAKHLFCLLAFSAIVLTTFSQPVLDRPKDFLAPPIEKIDKDFISSHNVKAIHAKAYQLSPSGIKKDAGDEELFQFDSLGHLVRKVEIESYDTAYVRDYFYTLEGALNWEVCEDKAWDKRYKSGYRLNRDKTVFQVKSYELLNDESAMLVDTRRYKYRQDGKHESIVSLANGRVSETHYFEYDVNNRLVGEFFKNVDERLLRSITYEYNPKGMLRKVSRIDFQRNNFTEEFIYAYNNRGDVVECQWLENDQLKGVVKYEYDGGGNLLRVESTLNRDRQKEMLVKEFEYQFYQN